MEKQLHQLPKAKPEAPSSSLPDQRVCAPEAPPPGAKPTGGDPSGRRPLAGIGSARGSLLGAEVAGNACTSETLEMLETRTQALQPRPRPRNHGHGTHGRGGQKPPGVAALRFSRTKHNSSTITATRLPKPDVPDATTGRATLPPLGATAAGSVPFFFPERISIPRLKKYSTGFFTSVSVGAAQTTGLPHPL